MKRLSFITQFKTEFFLPFTGCIKVLGKLHLDLYSKMTTEKNAEPIIIKKRNQFTCKFTWGEEHLSYFN